MRLPFSGLVGGLATFVFLPCALADDPLAAPPPPPPAAPPPAAPPPAATATTAPDPHELPDLGPPTAPKVKRISTFSIMGGLRLGLVLPDPGKIAAPPVNLGLDIAGEVGARFLRWFYGGLQFNGTLFISPKESDKSVSTWMLGTSVGAFTNPDGLGLLPTIGVGYRRISVTDVAGTSLGAGSVDLLLGLALHLKIGKDIRLLPRVDFATGTANDFAHYLFTIGVSGWFNHDF
jgi:hypothetical protein